MTAIHLNATSETEATGVAYTPGQSGCCRECGAAVALSKPGAFCCASCRQAWNNRRMARGAEVYDLFMAIRYEREASKLLGLWRLLCRLAAIYRSDDLKERDGRRTWRAPREVIAAKPYLSGSMVVGRR